MLILVSVQGEKYAPTTITVIFPSQHDGLTLQNCTDISSLGQVQEHSDATSVVESTIIGYDDSVTDHDHETMEYKYEVEMEHAMQEAQESVVIESSFLPLNSQLISNVGSISTIRCQISNELEWITWLE